MGGFDSMTCDLVVTPAEAEFIYQNLLGARVASFIDSPTQIRWEGFINRITYIPGNVAFSRSFDEMMNRVRVIYYRTDTATTPSTTAVNNTTSQGLYGIKEGSIDAEINYGSNVSHKTALGTINLAANA